MQVSAMYGFGRNMDTLSDEDAAKAKMWEMIGLTVGFITSTCTFPYFSRHSALYSSIPTFVLDAPRIL